MLGVRLRRTPDACKSTSEEAEGDADAECDGEPSTVATHTPVSREWVPETVMLAGGSAIFTIANPVYPFWSDKRMKTVVARVIGLTLALVCFFSFSARAQENAPDIVNNTCSMCHSEHGNNPNLYFVPRLAAQNAVYIKEQLEAFRDGSRADPPATIYMWPITHGLSEEQIKQAAAWYASQPAPTPFSKEASQEEGHKIFEKGVLKADVPACASCHGTKADGNGIFPRLAGQTPQYLLAQLRYFRSGVRNDKGADVMKPIAGHLTDGQMDAVAHYLSTL